MGTTTTAARSSVGERRRQERTIAFLLPENQTARYESSDRPLFEEKVKELCPDCKILYSNAAQDAAKQQQQAEAALTQGVEVMVLDPVDGAAAAAIVNQANAKKVPVISYDRLLLNSKPDSYVEFDSPSVGKIQGQALVDKLKDEGKKGSIVMINGAPTDNNAKLFKQGAHCVIDNSGFKVAKEYDTPGLDARQGPDRDGSGDLGARQERVRRRLRRQRRNRRRRDRGDEGRGHRSGDPAVTGQDAELAGIQRILTGDQYMTVYKPIKPLAEKAAEWAVALSKGKKRHRREHDREQRQGRRADAEDPRRSR